VGGKVATKGESEDALAVLRGALDVPADDPDARAHVHGFHSDTARRLIQGLSGDGAVVLDPFMGSGTVLVEARLLGRRALGTDLNPLAVELSHLKTRGTTAAERAALLAAARRVVDHAEERRVSRAGPTRPYGREDREMFDVHMLLELDGLSDGISRETSPFERNALLLVLSAILVKASRRPGDTAQSAKPRRLASGFAIRLFGKKTEELTIRLEDFEGRLPHGAPPAKVALEDARALRIARENTVDLVVSSPPYPGVYDYARHHDARLRWLGMDARAFERGEIGSRREIDRSSPAEALARWKADFERSLAAIANTMKSDARAVLILADSTVKGRALYMDDALPALAERASLEVLAVASQKRPHFHDASRGAFEGRARREHAFLLAPARPSDRARRTRR
jgi:DNA modification methylase